MIEAIDFVNIFFIVVIFLCLVDEYFFAFHATCRNQFNDVPARWRIDGDLFQSIQFHIAVVNVLTGDIMDRNTCIERAFAVKINRAATGVYGQYFTCRGSFGYGSFKP